MLRDDQRPLPVTRPARWKGMRSLRRALSEILAEDLLAARTVGGLFVVTAVSFIAASWGDLWLRCGALYGLCVRRSASAALVCILSVLMLAAGLGILVQTRRRYHREEQASSHYSWGLGILMAVGLILVSTRIPTWTCHVGHFDTTLKRCLTPGSRTDPTSYATLKGAILILGLAAGGIVGSLPNRVRILAPATALVWLFGVGWLLLDTMVWR